MILKLEAVTNDFIDAEVQGNGPDLKIQCPRDEHVAVAQFTRGLYEGLGLRKNRRLQRDFEEVVGQADEPVAMHPAVRPKREDVEQRAGVQIESEEYGHADQYFRELVDAFQNGSMVPRVIRLHRNEIAGQQRAIEIVKRGFVHKAGHIIAEAITASLTRQLRIGILKWNESWAADFTDYTDNSVKSV